VKTLVLTVGVYHLIFGSERLEDTRAGVITLLDDWLKRDRFVFIGWPIGWVQNDVNIFIDSNRS
jgi:hypothetical protein